MEEILRRVADGRVRSRTRSSAAGPSRRLRDARAASASSTQHLVTARKLYQQQRDSQSMLFHSASEARRSARDHRAGSARRAGGRPAPARPRAKAAAVTAPQRRTARLLRPPRPSRRATATRRVARLAPVRRPVARGARLQGRGRAARDWEVELSQELQKRWRRGQRVRLVFDPARPTVPRGAWFIAPGSVAAGSSSRPRSPNRCARAAPRSRRCRAGPADGMASVLPRARIHVGPTALRPGPLRAARGVPRGDHALGRAAVAGAVGRPRRRRGRGARAHAGAARAGCPPARRPLPDAEELEAELRARWLQSARETLEALTEERERSGR